MSHENAQEIIEHIEKSHNETARVISNFMGDFQNELKNHTVALAQIVEQNKIRNGRIQKAEDTLSWVKKMLYMGIGGGVVIVFLFPFYISWNNDKITSVEKLLEQYINISKAQAK